MAEITAALVKTLRERTDAPMMECKRALTESDGDLSKAEELLRIKLGNKASKAASRTTAEGAVAVHVQGHNGALLEVNCETDFVARNPDFSNFLKEVARLLTQYEVKDLEALFNLKLGANTVDEVRRELIGKIGENISIRRFERFGNAKKIGHYLHGTRIGVMVDFEGDDEVGKDLAMHIAASKPLAISRDQVPQEKIQTERAVAQGRAAESNKPPAIQEKMVEGAIQKFLSEVALLSQPFVKNPDISVEKMLQQKQAKVHRFVLYVVGEGLEKRTENFAEEVSAQLAAQRS